MNEIIQVRLSLVQCQGFESLKYNIDVTNTYYSDNEQ